MTASFTMSTGTVYYPTGAMPPFAAVAICPGFLNTGPEMTTWGPFYASWGIVCIVTNTGGGDLPPTRGDKLLAAIADLKTQAMSSGNPLNGKLAGLYGISGYSMGGGGVTWASEKDMTIKTEVGLAAFGPDPAGNHTATLMICSDSDTVASCGGSSSFYSVQTAGVPKMLLDIPGQSHFNWFSPTDALGESGSYALAFQKVYLEGDPRWKSVLQTKPAAGTMQSADVQ